MKKIQWNSNYLRPWLWGRAHDVTMVVRTHLVAPWESPGSQEIERQKICKAFQKEKHKFTGNRDASKIIPMWLVGLAREEVKFCCTVQSGSALDQVWVKDCIATRWGTQIPDKSIIRLWSTVCILKRRLRVFLTYGQYLANFDFYDLLPFESQSIKLVGISLTFKKEI